jgi:hypothetical protein
VLAKPGKVVTVNVALVAPPGTVTLNGTLAEPGWLLARLMATPFGGAGPPSLTVPVAEAPPTTLEGLTVIEESGGRVGYRVRIFDSVVPPPVTEMVTAVGPLTAAVVMSKKPTPLPAKTVTVSGTAASAGSLLSTNTIWSWPAPSAAVTTPCEPLVVVDIGLTSNDVGAGLGVIVTFHVWVTPAALAVMLATVVVETGLVWIENPVPLTPAGMVTLAGTAAAGESVERLTLNPAGPASPPPSRSTHPAMLAPPVARTCGWSVSLFSVGGRNVNWLEAVTPLSVALSVTTVGVVTCPTMNRNSVYACPPGIEMEAGTGATAGCELDS